MDNRPSLKNLKMQNQVIYVSATPADYELQKTEGVEWRFVLQLDPVIEIRPSLNQIDDLIEEITSV
jgi:excinuclease ABC subunit B